MMNDKKTNERWYVENRSGDFYCGPGRWTLHVDNAKSFNSEEEAMSIVRSFTPLMVRCVKM